jgi:hypothetical protein
MEGWGAFLVPSYGPADFVHATLKLIKPFGLAARKPEVIDGLEAGKHRLDLPSKTW